LAKAPFHSEITSEQQLSNEKLALNKIKALKAVYNKASITIQYKFLAPYLMAFFIFTSF